MRTISHRELRNDSSAVLREVQSGESITVTNRGQPVAVLVPVGTASDLRCVRPAKQRPSFSGIGRHMIAEPSAATLTELRDER
ncbi:MAG: type II toxin-antitoxin system Phd/YefM family antitoxin [Nocardioidaceae bacterium]